MAAVSIRREGIKTLVARDVVSFVNDVAKRVRRRAKRNAPRDTGKTRRSIFATPARVRGDHVRATISTRSGYGLYPEVGTGIYGPTGRVIRPKTKPFLVFQPRGVGHVIRVRSVRGQPGQHYMRDALLAVIAAL